MQEIQDVRAAFDPLRGAVAEPEDLGKAIEQEGERVARIAIAMGDLV